MQARPKEYRYKVGVIWESERRGFLNAAGKPAIRVATPPEFKGHEGVWTPEDLFVAAQATCFMMTFLGTAAHRGLRFEAFEAEAEGTLAREVIGFAEKDCLITHSIVSRVRVEPTILVLKNHAAPAA